MLLFGPVEATIGQYGTAHRFEGADLLLQSVGLAVGELATAYAVADDAFGAAVVGAVATVVVTVGGGGTGEQDDSAMAMSCSCLLLCSRSNAVALRTTSMQAHAETCALPAIAQKKKATSRPPSSSSRV